jgi:hypothetical protein
MHDLVKKLTATELSTLKKLSSPKKIQDFLDTLPINHEKSGETYMSVRRVLREKKAHCFEGALLAALALYVHGELPLLLDLSTTSKDIDHVVAIYKKNGYWGAISKTNHYCLRFRDPIYKTIRELAVSYFHEYFLNKTGEKTLRSYSKIFDLRKYVNKKGMDWVSSEEDVTALVDALEDSPHLPIFPKENLKFLRKADKTERKAGLIVEWKK